MKYFYKSSTAVIEGEEYNTYDVYIEDNNGDIENIPDFSVDVDETKEFIQYLKDNKITGKGEELKQELEELRK